MTFINDTPLSESVSDDMFTGCKTVRLLPYCKQKDGSYLFRFSDGSQGILPADECFAVQLQGNASLCVIPTAHMWDKWFFSQAYLYDTLLNKSRRREVVKAQIVKIEKKYLILDIGYGFMVRMSVNFLSPVLNKANLAFFSVGELIRVQLSFKDDKIKASCRELYNPDLAGFKVGDVVPGVVHASSEYGTFIEIAPYICGKLKKSISLAVGTQVLVVITRIDPETNHYTFRLLGKNKSNYIPDFSAIKVVSY